METRDGMWRNQGGYAEEATASACPRTRLPLSSSNKRSFKGKGPIMRKIVLAAAVAASALGLASCQNTAREADDVANAMAADADSLDEQAADAGDDIKEATEATAEEVSAAAERAAREAETMMEND